MSWFDFCDKAYENGDPATFSDVSIWDNFNRLGLGAEKSRAKARLSLYGACFYFGSICQLFNIR